MNIQQQIYPYNVYAISDAIWNSIYESENVFHGLSMAIYSLNINAFRNSDWNGHNAPAIRRTITQVLVEYEYSN